MVTALGQAPFLQEQLGEVHILSPWRLVDYWAWTREPNPDDFVIR
jgi:4-hydroxyacetophenone monooxygenase